MRRIADLIRQLRAMTPPQKATPDHHAYIKPDYSLCCAWHLERAE